MAKPPTPVELTFNVEVDSYATFMSTLRGKLAGAGGKNVEGHPVLDGQTGEDLQPPRWIYVVLSSGGGVKPKVAIRSDNAYIVGFTNSQGNWFQFKNKGGVELLPKPTTLLGFSGHYSDLIGRPDVNLPTLRLGRINTSGAATVLWNHRKKKEADAFVIDVGDDASGLPIGSSDPLKDLKKALATLAVTLCEAARLIPVHGVVDDGWEKEKGSSVNEKQVKYINKWSKLSEALLGWNGDKDENWFKYLKDSTGISTGKDALEVVQLLLNNPPKGMAGTSGAPGEEDPEAAQE